MHGKEVLEKVKQALRRQEARGATNLHCPHEQTAKKRPSSKKHKRRVKKRRLQAVSPIEQVARSDLNILDEDPVPLDWTLDTASSQEELIMHFSPRQTLNSSESTITVAFPWDVDFCKESTSELKEEGGVMRYVSITTGDTEDQEGCKEDAEVKLKDIQHESKPLKKQDEMQHITNTTKKLARSISKKSRQIILHQYTATSRNSPKIMSTQKGHSNQYHDRQYPMKQVNWREIKPFSNCFSYEVLKILRQIAEGEEAHMTLKRGACNHLVLVLGSSTVSFAAEFLPLTGAVLSSFHRYAGSLLAGECTFEMS